MVDISKMKVGDRVHYKPSRYNVESENGIIKEIPGWTDKSVRVVYNCGGDWDNFEDYTSALTDICDLHCGWKDE